MDFEGAWRRSTAEASGCWPPSAPVDTARHCYDISCDHWADDPTDNRPAPWAQLLIRIGPADVYINVTRVGLPIERMSDEALLAGLGVGDSAVSLAFVRRFQAEVYAIALAIVGDPGSAEDVAQRTFERVWRRSSTFDPERGNVRTWLVTITRNMALDTLKRRKPDPVDPTDLVRLLGPSKEEPEDTSIRNESRSQLQAALRSLPTEQARALVMAGVYRMTAQEVADVEGIPLGTAKTRIRLAMIKLRAYLPSAEVTHD